MTCLNFALESPEMSLARISAFDDSKEKITGTTSLSMHSRAKRNIVVVLPTPAPAATTYVRPLPHPPTDCSSPSREEPPPRALSRLGIPVDTVNDDAWLNITSSNKSLKEVRLRVDADSALRDSSSMLTLICDMAVSSSCSIIEISSIEEIDALRCAMLLR